MLQPETLLRVFINEADKLNHTPLYERIVAEAHANGMAGATASRGLLSYGYSGSVHTRKVLDLSSNLPIIIDIVDKQAKIDAFLLILDELLENAGCGGLVTVTAIASKRYDNQ